MAEPAPVVPAGQELELVCPRCSLSFDSKRALAIHIDKFCGKIKELGDDRYGPATDFKSYMTFDDVKRYLESHGLEDPNAGKLSLEDVKQNVQSSDFEMRSLRAQLQKKAAEQKVDELKKLKVRQQQARSNKVREDAELADLIQLELQQKEKELKAGIQRERTQRELRKVKEGKLNELQDEKSRSLAMLEKEKEALRRREQEVMDQIKRLENRIIQKDKQLEEEAKQLATAPGKEALNRSSEARKSYEKLAKEHGSKLAQMEEKKRRLSEEQKQFEADLKAVQAREAAEHVKVADKDIKAALDGLLNSETGLREQEARVANLKEKAAVVEPPPISLGGSGGDGVNERDAELRALRSDRPTRLPLAQDAEKMLDQWLKADAASTDPSKNPFASLAKPTPSGATSNTAPEPVKPPPPAPPAVSKPPAPAQRPTLLSRGAGDTFKDTSGSALSMTGEDDMDTHRFSPPPLRRARTLRRSPSRLPSSLSDTDDALDAEATSSPFGRTKRSKPAPPPPVASPKRVSLPEPEERQGSGGHAGSGSLSDKERLLRELEQMKKRYREQGGRPGPVLDRIDQLEAELMAPDGPPPGQGPTAAGAMPPYMQTAARPGMMTAVPFQTMAQPPMAGGYPYNTTMAPSPYANPMAPPPPPPFPYPDPLSASSASSSFYPGMTNSSGGYGGPQPAGQDPFGPGPWQTTSMAPYSYPAGLSSQQQNMWQTYSQLAHLEAENARIMPDDFDLSEPRIHPRMRQQPRDDDGEDGMDDLDSTPRLEHDASQDALALYKKQAALEALMRTLSTLPAEHKLHQMFESHVEEVTTLQLEVERIRKLCELELLKARIVKEKERALKRLEDEDLLEEQRRMARLNKLKGGGSVPLGNSPPPPAPYDASSGFTVHLDFALGLPDRLQSGQDTRKARIVYGLYENMRAFGSPASSEWLPCHRLERAMVRGPGATAAILGLELPFVSVPLLPTLCLIVEVHAADDSAVGNSNKVKFQPAGWGYLHVFDPATLSRGYHKLKLLSGSFSPAALDVTLKAAAGLPVPPGRRPTPNGSVLCLRLMGSKEPVPDVDVENPPEAFDLYITPPATPAVGGGPPAGYPGLPSPQVPIRQAAPSPLMQPIKPPPPRPPSVTSPVNFRPLDMQPPPSQDGLPPGGQRRNSLGRRNSLERRASQESERGSRSNIFGGNQPGGGRASNNLRPVPEGSEQGGGSPSTPLLGDPRLSSNRTPEQRSAAGNSDEVFIENRVPGGGLAGKRKSFRAGDGFNVYLDGARGLPDNVTICKASVRVLTSKNQLVGAESVCHSSPESRRACPMFNGFTEYRGDSFDPTCTVLVRVDTIDSQSSKKLTCVGYAVLNVFNESSPADPAAPWPTTPSCEDFQLNSGAFQVPVHQGPPNLKADFSAASLDQVKRVPCATLLLRLLPAAPTEDGLSVLDRDDVPKEEWEATGVWLPAPPYEQGRYDTTRCAPSEVERTIYQRRSRKENSANNQTLQAAVVETFPPPDGPPGLSPDKVTEWMVAKLASKPTEMIDFTFLLRYQPDLGFKVAVDGLFNLPAPGMMAGPKFYKVVFLLSPPGLYFNDPPLTEDANFTRTYDLDSPLIAPTFTDGYHAYKDVPYEQSTVVLFEIRAIKQDKAQQNIVESAGEGYWSALPVFRSVYVNNGSFQVPLFKGTVPPVILGAADVYEKIREQLKGNASLPKSAAKPVELSNEGASLSVRLVDTLLDEHADPLPFTGVDARGKKNTSYIKMACEAASCNTFLFDPKPPSDKTLRKCLPKKVDQTTFLKDLNVKLAAATKINHYMF